MGRIWIDDPMAATFGHLTDRGFWHSGRADDCDKCSPPGPESAHPGSTVCQFCRRDLGDSIEKRVHATLRHHGEQPSKFAACRSGHCNERVFIGSTCTGCGTYQDPKKQTLKGAS